jgi:zinc ribbon protein
MKIGKIGNERKSMSATDTCPTCNANVSGESRFCSECGTPLPDPEGVEVRLRKYWSSPDLSLLLGLALAGLGIVLVGFQAWLWGIVALAVAAVVFVLRSKAGRREVGALAGGVRARVDAHRRVVGARSHGQLELFRLRRELSELQSERTRGYHELGRATHLGEEEKAREARATLDDVSARIAAKETEIGALVGRMQERVRQAQAEITPTSLMEAPPEPARVPEPYPPPDEGDPPEPAHVPEPFPAPVPEPAPDDPPPEPQLPPAPETKRRRRTGAPKA